MAQKRCSNEGDAGGGSGCRSSGTRGSGWGGVGCCEEKARCWGNAWVSDSALDSGEAIGSTRGESTAGESMHGVLGFGEPTLLTSGMCGLERRGGLWPSSELVSSYERFTPACDGGGGGDGTRCGFSSQIELRAKA